MTTGYCGSDSYEALAVEDDATDCEIYKIAREMAIENAASYGLEIGCYDENSGLEEDDPECEYIEEMIGYSFEEYNGEDHDDYRSGGGSFSDDFDAMYGHLPEFYN